MNEKINLATALNSISDYWSPRPIARMNEYNVMLVKVQGTFVWHKHDATDDFFLVLKGALEIQMRDRTVTLGPGELFVVPKEAHILLIEPVGTVTTGDPHPTHS
jgi:mannose-6-phosphate isomerase-like protein (cupin superfamily)